MEKKMIKMRDCGSGDGPKWSEKAKKKIVNS
jgi:hypothetical protein